MKNKKAQGGLGGLAGAAITFVVITVVIVIGLDLLTDVQDGFTANSAESNVTEDGIVALGALSSRLDLLATAVVLGVIIVVLLRVFKAF